MSDNTILFLSATAAAAGVYGMYQKKKNSPNLFVPPMPLPPVFDFPPAFGIDYAPPAIPALSPSLGFPPLSSKDTIPANINLSSITLPSIPSYTSSFPPAFGVDYSTPTVSGSGSTLFKDQIQSQRLSTITNNHLSYQPSVFAMTDINPFSLGQPKSFIGF